ncbi:hypothetical protein, partial [Tianweitania sp.]|uniref:hypothetical protein n=1 Tax=Tianweitania sp. TaxID=2021634 RepID=UPI00289BF8FA
SNEGWRKQGTAAGMLGKLAEQNAPAIPFTPTLRLAKGSMPVQRSPDNKDSHLWIVFLPPKTSLL